MSVSGGETTASRPPREKQERPRVTSMRNDSFDNAAKAKRKRSELQVNFTPP